MYIPMNIINIFEWLPNSFFYNALAEPVLDIMHAAVSRMIMLNCFNNQVKQKYQIRYMYYY